MQNIFNTSLHNKILIITVLLLIAPAMLLTAIIAQSVKSSNKAITQRLLEIKIQNQKTRINGYLQKNQELMKNVAQDSTIANELEKYDESGNYNDNEIYAKLASLQNEIIEIKKIYITNKDGLILTSTTSNDERKNITAFNITLPITQDATYLTLRNNDENEAIITLAIPISSKKTLQHIGYLFQEINAPFIQKIMLETDADKQNTENEEKYKLVINTSIVTTDGDEITDNARIAKKNSNPNKLPKIKCTRQEETERITWKDENKKEITGIYTCNKYDNLEFAILTTIDIDNEYNDNMQRKLIAGTILILVLLIITSKMIKNQIANPIQKLSEEIKAITKGNTENALKGQIYKEFEPLQNAITELKQNIQTITTNIQQQIQELKNKDTEREREKISIQEEKNKIEAIINSIPDALITLNKERKIISCNNAAIELLNMTKDKLVGQSIEKIIELYDNAEPIEVDKYAPNDNKEYEGIIYSNDHIKLYSSGGKTTMVKMVSKKIKNTTLQNIAYILTFHDLSKEAQLEDMKLDFVSMAAHELRTPITSIRGYAQLLKEELAESTDEQTTEWKTLLTRITISAEQLLALVENLLNVTKIEKGILTLACKPEVWKELIEEVVAVFKERAENKKITLTVHEIDPSLIAYVDKIRINEVISNLISNAINYTQEGGCVDVEVHVTPDGKWIETSVKDNGKGIPKTAQTHLFEKFFRVTGPLEEGSKGNGLGLYISKSIVEMHGGKIWVESDEGKGAKFSYTVQRIDNKDVAKYSY